VKIGDLVHIYHQSGNKVPDYWIDKVGIIIDIRRDCCHVLVDGAQQDWDRIDLKIMLRQKQACEKGYSG
jgi:hypothetical protein